jgi:Putative auto-transporter adhesin, head GIN domain
MKKIIMTLFIGVMLIFQACSYIDSGNGGGVRGEGNIITESRQVSGFKGVELAASGDVLIEKGSAFKVTVETQKNIAEILVTEVEGNVLKIYFKNNWGNVHYDKLIVHIEMPELEKLDLSGSGLIRTENAFEGDKLDMFLGGSGNIEVKQANYKNIDAQISGSGDIELAGNAVNAEYEVSGSGGINSKDLKAKKVQAEITGSGGIDCFAETELEANITGSGNIEYGGTPSVKSRITGSGEVVKH